jgi:hypothetical protein
MRNTPGGLVRTAAPDARAEVAEPDAELAMEPVNEATEEVLKTRTR